MGGDLSVANDVVVDGDCVAWRGRASRAAEQWITALGEDAHALVRCVRELASRFPPDGVTVSECAYDALPDELRSPDPGHWCYWTRPAVPDGLDADGAVRLADDDDRITGLLAHSTSAHVFPGNEEVVAWYGVQEADELRAVAARITEPSGAAHLVSVCTHPGSRGGGLARAVCSRAMLDAIQDGAPMIVLEMYVANDDGRRLYSRLGFREEGRYLSGLLAGADG